MLYCDFTYYLRKLNPKLKVDLDRELTYIHPDFPVAGLYYDNKYLFGVPHKYIPEYTWEDVQTHKIIARGWRFIFSELCNRGYFSRKRAEKLLNTHLQPGRTNWPKVELNLDLDNSDYASRITKR